MLNYQILCTRPSIFRSLTGMSKDEFDALHKEFVVAEREANRSATTTVHGKPRQRAVGAGKGPKLDSLGRLLMALFWLRVYPTYEVLGFFFGLHKRNAQLGVRKALSVLQSMHPLGFDRPDKNRRKLSSPEQVMDLFPDVRLVIDAKEQRVQRPAGGYEAQKPYYSGKKKCHTVKTQIAVGPDGLIESVSDTHPGGATHDTTLLLKTKLMDELDHPNGESGMFDKGYHNIPKHLPERPIVMPTKATRGHPITPEQKQENKVIAGYRIVVEHSIAQINRFQVLKQVFRGRTKHHSTRHSQVVKVVAGVVNRRIEACPLKTYSAAA